MRETECLKMIPEGVKKRKERVSVGVQWLRLHTPTAGGAVQSLVGELRIPAAKIF